MIEKIIIIKKIGNFIIEITLPIAIYLLFLGIFFDNFRFIIDWIGIDDIYIWKIILAILASFFLSYLTDFSKENFKDIVKYYLLFLSVFSLSIISFLRILEIDYLMVLDTIVYLFIGLVILNGSCLFLFTINNNKIVAKATAFLLWFMFFAHLATLFAFLCLIDKENKRSAYCLSVFTSINMEKNKTQ